MDIDFNFNELNYIRGYIYDILERPHIIYFYKETTEAYYYDSIINTFKSFLITVMDTVSDSHSGQRYAINQLSSLTSGPEIRNRLREIILYFNDNPNIYNSVNLSEEVRKIANAHYGIDMRMPLYNACIKLKEAVEAL